MMSTKNIYIIEDKNSDGKIDSFLQLYPPVKNFYDFDRQYDLYKDKKNSPKFLSNGLNEDMNLDQEEDTYEINDDFFGSILGKNNYYLDKDKKIKTISKVIRKSKLMLKLEKEFHGSGKTIDLCALSDMCAKNLSFMELKKGKILFKIGDKGDRFYFILSGKITILKPRQINYKMNFQEYLFYLLILIKEKEDYLLNEVIMNNCTQIPITTVEEIKTIYRIIFITKLKENLDNGIIDNNKHLKIFFDKNLQTFHDYNIDINNLEILEKKKTKTSGNKQWIMYILQNCNLTKADLRSLGRYKAFEEKKNIICYVYDSFLYLGPGFFFGDAALDEKVNKRNATIRAEEDTILGFLKSVDYLNMIAPQRKLEKMNEINFLINNFFFKNINIPIFEKKFFHLFTLNENNRYNILFNSGSIPQSLIFLKEGKVSLSLKCSVIDINKLIVKICKQVINSYSDKLIQKKIITKEKINILKGYIEGDKILSNLKNYSNEFVKEINKKRTFQIAVFNSAVTIGLEEIFLQIPYITQGVVISEKIIYYKLSIEKIKSILLENHHINYIYIKSAINKIFSLIKRFQNLKQNYIDIVKMRFENPNSFRYKNLPNLKNINNNDLFKEDNNIEFYSTLAQNYSVPRIQKKSVKVQKNIGTEIKKAEKEYQILSYSENKAQKNLEIDTDNNDIYKNIICYKSPLKKIPYIKNNMFLSVFLDSKTGNKFKINKKDSNYKKSINNNKQSRFSAFLTSLKKKKSKNLINIKINDEKSQKEENKVKNTEIKINEKRLFSSINYKKYGTIQIGDKSITLKALKRRIRNSDCQIYDRRKPLLEIIQSNNYYYMEKIKSENNNFYTNSSNQSENKSFEKANLLTNLHNRKKSSIIRKIQNINNYNLSFVPLLNKKEEENENMIKSYKKINNNNENNINNIYNNGNCISLLINKENLSRNINSIFNKKKLLQNNNSFNYKNNKLFLQKMLFNKKSLSNKNILIQNEELKANEYENFSELKQNIKNNEISLNKPNPKKKIKKLPSIIRKKLELNKSNDLKNENYHFLIQKELIPEIVKNYYNDKKMKGYASLIPHKESNTLFLRKFHKKYNQNRNQSQNEKEHKK